MEEIGVLNFELRHFVREISMLHLFTFLAWIFDDFESFKLNLFFKKVTINIIVHDKKSYK